VVRTFIERPSSLAKIDGLTRFTQLGLLRLLTNEQVMGPDVLTQRKAWQGYHRWFNPRLFWNAAAQRDAPSR
jgi:hypothetical protein